MWMVGLGEMETMTPERLASHESLEKVRAMDETCTHGKSEYENYGPCDNCMALLLDVLQQRVERLEKAGKEWAEALEYCQENIAFASYNDRFFNAQERLLAALRGGGDGIE